MSKNDPTDIAMRLRAVVPSYEGTPVAWPCKTRSELLLEAAAEIERLRAEIEPLRKAMDVLEGKP